MGFLKHFRACVDDCSDCKPGPCDSCCPTFAVEYRSLSASKTKCGLPEWAGFESTPPKVYLTKTQSGSITHTSGADTRTTTWSGSVAYSRPACGSPSDSRSVNVTDTFYDPDCDVTINAPDSYAFADAAGGVSPQGNYAYEIISCTGSPSVFHGPADSSLSTTATTKTISADQSGFSGTVTITLSDEYTTALLYTDAEAAWGAASWSSWGTTPTSAIYDVSSDEMTITLRAFEWRVLFDEPAPAGCKLEWDVFIDGSPVFHNCVDITPGATSYGPDYIPYVLAGNEWSVNNFAITSGAC